jgi:hypothetical protein
MCQQLLPRHKPKAAPFSRWRVAVAAIGDRANESHSITLFVGNMGIQSIRNPSGKRMRLGLSYSLLSSNHGTADGYKLGSNVQSWNFRLACHRNPFPSRFCGFSRLHRSELQRLILALRVCRTRNRSIVLLCALRPYGLFPSSSSIPPKRGYAVVWRGPNE